MRKITMTVPDDMVGAIVALVVDQVTELRIEAVPGHEPVRPARSAPGRRIGDDGLTAAARVVMGALPASIDTLKRAMEDRGYGRSTAYGVVGRLVAQGHAKLDSDGKTYRHV
jgi:hypothetical protein